MDRTFTRKIAGGRTQTRTVATAAEAVRLKFDGWAEETKPKKDTPDKTTAAKPEAAASKPADK